MVRRIVVPLPWLSSPLAQNDRQHWATKARAFAQTKTEARWAIRAAKVPTVEACEVTLHWRVPNWKIRDADGPAPTLKAVLDALVAEAVIASDSFTHIPACGLRIHPPEKGMPAAMWLELVVVKRTEKGDAA